MELFSDTLKCSCDIIPSISLIHATTVCIATPGYIASSFPPPLLCELTWDSGVAWYQCDMEVTETLSRRLV